VAYVWPRVGYPPLVTPFSQYVKNLALMNVTQMLKGKDRWSIIADDIWDMLLGKAGRLPGTLAPELVEKAKEEGREFFDGNPQDNYPDALDKYRTLMKEEHWDTGEDDEELFEYAMHPAQYEAYRSGKAKADFVADISKRIEEKNAANNLPKKPQTLSVDVNGQAYRVTVSFGDAAGAVPSEADEDKTPEPAAPIVSGEGEPLLAPLEGKFFLVKNASDTPVKVGDVVRKGQTVCFVEAMKVYNAVAAENDGVVTAICLKSGDFVEEDKTVLMIIK